MSTESPAIELLEPMSPATKQWPLADFSGTAIECLHHFVINNPTAEDIAAFGNLIGMKEDGVRKWWSCTHRPSGLRLLRVRFVLERYGYTLNDGIGCGTSLSKFARAVAYGLLSFRDAQNLLDVQAGQLRRILWGRTGTSPVSLDMLQAYAKENEAVLAEFEANIFGDKRLEELPSAPAGAPPTEMLVKNDLLRSCAHLILALQPLADVIASDSFSPADRVVLRELTGKYGVFNLKNALVRLCGERARLHGDGNA